MAFRIITADERLSAAENKTSLAIFGPPGVGKTTLLKSLPAEETVCLDLEAGLKSVQDWRGDSLPIRRFADAVDIACLIGGANPAAQPDEHFSEAHHAHLRGLHCDLASLPQVFRQVKQVLALLPQDSKSHLAADSPAEPLPNAPQLA